MSATGARSPGLKKFAMFMAGFSLLQTLRVAITAGRFAVVRFGIPNDKIGVFINAVHHSMETAGDVGLLLMSLYVLFGEGSSISHYVLSVVAIWGLFFMNILLLFAYITGGQQGHLTFYYWVLVLASLGFGLDESISITIGVANVSYFGLGMPLSGIMACLYHALYLYLARKFQWRDTYFWIVIGQIAISVLVSGIAAIVWSIAYRKDEECKCCPCCPCKKESKNPPCTCKCANNCKANNGGSSCNCQCCRTGSSGSECTNCKDCKCECQQSSSTGANNGGGDLLSRAKNAASNILMCLCGMSCIYAFYPAIAPYQFLSPKAGHKVDLALLFTSAIPPLIIATLCYIGKGPDKSWHKGKSPGWHAIWTFMIPYLAAVLLCIFAIHYPDGRSSRAMYGNIWNVGAITVTLKCCEEILKGVANSGVGMQDENKGGDGQLSALNALSAQFTMDLFAYIGGGYLKAFKKYENDRDKWPTKHYGRLRSFWFWIWSSLKGGFTCIGESFTLNIRSKVVKKREYLFIVHEDVEDSKYIFDVPKPQKKEYLFVV